MKNAEYSSEKIGAKGETNCLRSTDVEIVDKYILRSNLWTFDRNYCQMNRRVEMTKDQFLIDKVIMKNYRRKLTNLSMAWTDYRKAYDMVPIHGFWKVQEWLE